MTRTSVEDARRGLGPLGVYLPVALTENPPVAEQIEAARRLEAAGYRTLWVNDAVGGKDVLVQLAMLLAGTDRVVFGTGIANVWSLAPQAMHGGATWLAETYPGRLVLGLGAGHPEQAAGTGRDFGRPLSVVRDYLGRMDAPSVPPARDAPYPRILAANGEKMLALAGELTDGALPAGRPPEFTEHARQVLGPDKLLVVALAADPDPAATASAVRAHRDAGADHVVLLPSHGPDLSAEVTHLEGLAPDLIAASGG